MVMDRVITGIKLALDEAGIDIPYPHTVVLNQASATSGGASQQNASRDQHEMKTS